MDITYISGTNVRVKSKTGIVLLNPTTGGSADIVTSSTSPATLKGISGTSRREKPFVIEQPGEYEVEGISVFGYQEEGSEILFVVQAEDVRILHVGTSVHEISEKMITELDGIDAVCVPATPADTAIKLVEKIDPYYVIPMGEKTEIEAFAAKYGRTPRTVKSLAVSKISMPQDVTEVIVFES